jgi:uncharacterized protein
MAAMSNNGFEVRFTESTIEQHDNGTLVGYAARWNSPSVDLGGFIEIIKPGAFAKSLVDFPDVLALVEHDTAKPLARTLNKSLTLVEDDQGLRAEIIPADTSYARDVRELVRAGTVRGMSFRFMPFPGGAHLDTSKHPALRTLTSVRLSEVSIVLSPAYPETSIQVRHAVEQQVRNAKARLRLATI